MRFSNLLAIFLSTTSTASGFIVPRSPQDILSQISTIGANLQSFLMQLNNYDGKFSNAVSVETSEKTLDNSIQQGTKVTEGTTGTLSESDGNSVLDAVESLIPDIVSAANAFVVKEAVFSSAGLAQVASTDLNMLQTDTSNFASALLAIAPSQILPAATSAVNCINAAFSSAAAGSSASNCGATLTASGSSKAPSISTPASTSGSSPSTTTTSTTSTGNATVSPSSLKSGSSLSYHRSHGLLGESLAVVFVLALGKRVWC